MNENKILLNFDGDIEKCLKGTRRHLITHEDSGFTDFGER